jgi:endoglucanase
MRKLSVLGVLFTTCTLVTAQTVLRVNQLGYIPNAVKVAVAMSKDTVFSPRVFELRDALTDEIVWTSTAVREYGAYATFPRTYRLDFSAMRIPGAYVLSTEGFRSPSFRIAADVYDGTADFLLQYMRQQRCGFNPFLKDSCHTHDGYIIDHPTLDSTFIDVVGGWHDASDYLQYVTTSANAVFQMLFAYEQDPKSFEDAYDAAGRAGSNGVPDILDEVKWGLDWLVKMNPRAGLMFNQIADDRDHMGFRLPTEDTISYGKGLQRPVYFCSGRPQGLMVYKNRTTGIASTAAKFSSAFALGSLVLQQYYPDFAATIKRKAMDAYSLAKAHPGVCQTAPCRAPYFYEEENWADDMELAATQLYRLSGDTSYRHDAMRFGEAEPVVPWMGADGARHYQWYPFVNLGHFYLAFGSQDDEARQAVSWLREGVDRVWKRAKENPFLFGVPFIWCSNNLVGAMLTQASIYRKTSGDSTYRFMEAALRDWLFGCNPWGTSMIVGMPSNGVAPKDPHSAFTHLHGYPVNGGLVDGPVKASIFNALKGVHLSKDDALKDFQSEMAVYHDDWADYSTDEPTMDGTASLTYYLSMLQGEGELGVSHDRLKRAFGGIVRMDSTRKEIYLVFTGHAFADGGEPIRKALLKHGAKASFFFTGDFYRNPRFKKIIEGLIRDGHYLGAHSDHHVLYASWENRDSSLVSRQEFLDDLKGNYLAMSAYGISKRHALWYLPPYEWYNRSISQWCNEVGITLVNFTAGTRSNADYTVPGQDHNYVSSDVIEESILNYEAGHSVGLNGFILLMHIGVDPHRTDKLYDRLDRLLRSLEHKGYSFRAFSQ